MTVVDHEPTALTAGDARGLTDRIKVVIGGAWELIKQAYECRAHAALGYPSWDAYCSAEFGASRLRLPREEREEVVASLRDSGLSIRAIAAATGDSPRTVRRDLASGGAFAPPAATPEWAPLPDPVAEVEEAPAGYLDTDEITPEDDDLQWAATHAAPAEDDRPVPPAPKVTGTDGKQYPAAPTAPPAKARRTSLVDVAAKAGWEFRKSVERLERIADDDRFPANRDQVAAQLRGHLTYATEVLTDLLRGLDTSPTED